VPVLKLKLRGAPEIDISLGDGGGRAAAEFVAAMAAAHPLLVPLVLVLKSMLRLVRGTVSALSGWGAVGSAEKADSCTLVFTTALSPRNPP